MKKLEQPLIRMLTLNGWEPDGLKGEIGNLILDYHQQHKRSWGSMQRGEGRSSTGTKFFYYFIRTKISDDRKFDRVLGNSLRLMRFDYWKVSPQLKIRAYCLVDAAVPLFEFIYVNLSSEQDQEAEEKRAEKTKGHKSGPSDLRIRRANAFRDIKEKHPKFTQQDVADYAWKNRREDIGEDYIDGETVRNDYREFEWKWERGERDPYRR